MADPYKYHMISPPAYVYDMARECHSVYGWREVKGAVFKGTPLEPIVGNPDGPGIGPWTLYFGDDPWTTSLPS